MIEDDRPLSPPSPRTLLVTVALVAALLASFPAAGSPEKTHRTVCRVCQVLEGETEAEVVKATTEYQGQLFHFCSETCRERFLEDPEGFLPPVLPRPLPSFAVVDGEGAPVTSGSLTGRPLLLDMWATWCQPCVTALPELDALYRELRGGGLAVVGISIDEGDQGVRKARKLAEKRGVSYPVLYDQGAQPAWEALKVKALPMMFLVDAEGRIVDQWSGRIDLAQVRRRAAALLERP
jgi:thiol-disulfide isomerase/thioredoxin